MKRLNKTTKNNPLYIFDFDETLARNKGGIRIQSSDGSTRPLSLKEYYVYKLKAGETVNLDDFQHANNLSPISRYISLLRKHIAYAVVLSARTPDKTPQMDEFFGNLDIKVASFGVGIDDDSETFVVENAQRKKEWILREIHNKNLTYVEFWDDNPLNIKAVDELKEELPGVTVVTHLVS